MRLALTNTYRNLVSTLLGGASGERSSKGSKARGRKAASKLRRRQSLVERLEDRRVLATLALVDFETNAGYTTSFAEYTDNGTDYFTRTNGSNITGEVFNNIQGSSYFAAQDTDGDFPGRLNLTLDMNQIDISSVTGNLAFSVFIAEDQAADNQEDWDADTSVRFAYSIDGGAFQNLIAVESSGGTNTQPAIDTNFDGVGNGTFITDTFTQFTASIPGLGSTLNIRVFFDVLDAGDEDIAIDSLEVTGDTIDTTPPTVVSITHNEDNLDNSVASGEMVTYTVTFSEDIDHLTVAAEDFFNAGTSAVTFDTIAETTPGVFTIQVTPTNAGTLRLGILDTANISDASSNANLLVVPSGGTLDEVADVITVTAGDITPPTVVSIDDNDADNIVAMGATVTYTLVFSEPIVAAPLATDFSVGGGAIVSFSNVQGSGTTYTVDVTADTPGTILLTLAAGSVEDAAGNALAADAVDADTLTVDGTAPLVLSIVDNVSGGPIGEGATVIYTVTFSEDIDSATVTSADFTNAVTTANGSNADIAPFSVGTITETGPGIFSVAVTATGPGRLTLQIPSDAVILDVVGNNLLGFFDDDTDITVNAVTALQPGDLAFVAFQADNSGGGFNGDAFQFVLLAPVISGTTVFFTDNGYLTTTSTFRTNENMLRWVAQANLPAGTIVQFTAPGGTGAASTAEWTGITPSTGATLPLAAFGLAGGGDNITALRAPVFGGSELLNGVAIAQITFGGATFATTFDVSSGNVTTALAPGLTDGVNAVSLAGTDNGRYNENAVGSVESGSQLAVGTSLNTDTFWATSNTPLTTPGHTPGTFVIGNDTTPPTLVSMNDNDGGGPVAAGDILTYTVTFNEDIDATTVTAADFDNDGTAGITIGTITETSPTSGAFSVQVTTTSAGTLRLRIPTGAVITDVAGNALAVPVSDDTEVTVTAGDVTAPTVTTITDDTVDGVIGVGATVTYTVTFSEDIDGTFVNENDFNNAGTSTFTIGTIIQTAPGAFTVPVTATSEGTVQLQIPTTATIQDLAGNALVVDPAILDAETIQVDGTAPMLTSIADNISGGPGFTSQPITFTVTFNEDIDAATVTAADFNNAGTSTVTFGAITETTAGVFSVVVTPTTAGTVQLRIPTTAVIADLGGNNLNVTTALLDDTTITINAVTTLAVGDVSVIGYRADADDGLSFVTWVDLLPGTSINFWDAGYIGGGDGTGQGAGGGTWLTTENFATWSNSTGGTIAAGTVLVMSFPNLAGRTADLGSVEGALSGLSATGDQIFVGQGQFSLVSPPTNTPSTFIGNLVFGFDFGGAAGWDGSATDSNTSALPTVLDVTNGNFTVAHVDNGQYTGARQVATLAGGRTAALNVANWTTNNDGPAFGSLDSTDFTLSTPGFVIVERDGTTRVFENGNPGLAGVDGRTDEFTVVLSSQPTSNVVLTVVSPDTGEATVSPATLTFTPANWNTPQTVTVTGVVDNEAVGNQTVNVAVAVDDLLSDDAYDDLADQIVSVLVLDTPNRPTVTAIDGETATPTISFNSVSGATGYTMVVIDISVSPAVEVFRDDTIPGGATSYPIPGSASLATNRTYRAFLFASNGANNYSPAGGLTGPQFAFTQFTVGGAPATPPARPVANSTSGLPNRPTISWPAASAPAADFYSVYLINLGTGALVQSATGIVPSQFTPSSDLASGRYRIWVSATNAAGNSGFGAPFDFNVGTPVVVPTAPTGINASNPAMITWTASPGATTYNVWLINRATNAVVASNRGLTQPNFTPSPALADGSYRIWVSASNVAGTSSFSAPHDFFVGTPLVFPTVPTGFSVAGLGTLRPTVTWNVVPTATSYAIWFINRDTGTLISAVTNITTNSFTPSSDLMAGGNYRIWVRAVNALGSSTFSSPFDFKLDDPTPVL